MSSLYNKVTQGLQGPQGSEGAKGPDGELGPDGYQGINGLHGINGNTGEIGPQGNYGSQGNQGSQGNRGSQGSQGSIGYQGSQGNQGLPGSVNNWTLLYELDFSTLNNQTISGGFFPGTDNQINNKTWKAENTIGAGRTIQIVNGTGLNITGPSAYPWTINNRAAAIIHIPIANLGTLPSTPHDIRVMAHVSFNPGVENAWLILAVEPIATASGWTPTEVWRGRRGIRKGYISNSNIVDSFIEGSFASSSIEGVSIANFSKTITSENVIGMEIYGSESTNSRVYPIRAIKSFYGTYSSGWPSNLTYFGSLFGKLSDSNVNGNSLNTGEGTSLAIGAYSDSTVSTIVRFKVEYKQSSEIIMG